MFKLRPGWFVWRIVDELEGSYFGHTCSCIWRLQCRLVRLRSVSARCHQGDKCAKVEKFGGVPYPPEVTNFTPSLPLDRRGQGYQSTEFENCCVASMWNTGEVTGFCVA
jgi:hypothetical protein